MNHDENEHGYAFEEPDDEPTATTGGMSTQSEELAESVGVYDPRPVTLAFSRSELHKIYTCTLLFTGQRRAWAADCGPAGLIDATVADLRSLWDETIRKNGLRRAWNLTSHDQTALAGVFNLLAHAGRKAFRVIFDEQDDPARMPALRAALTRRLRRAEGCLVGVWSDDLYAPWALLCLPPGRTGSGGGGRPTSAAETASGPPPTAAESCGPQFLGYRHLIEHRALRREPRCPSARIPVHGARPRALALVTEDAPDSHALVDRLLRDATDDGTGDGFVHCGHDTSRFLNELHADRFRRQIIYAYCHGQGYRHDPARLWASADPEEAISAADIIDAVKGADGEEAGAHECGRVHLVGSPLLYLSVCRAADFNAADGASVARALARLGTSCTVAPEVILPMELAAEHAQRFFGPFLAEGVSVGRHLLEVTWALAKDAGNLLGLTYAVKGRMDTRLGR
ncbi:hypothetical protein V2W30_11675 [Streptomyces sp. Q6]|uniref:Uncharacterized protein n=1 Tax=Streptomyces citrinus TaxID=3118173 RepID=A0ACD5A9Q9_9ACTN